MKSGGKALVRDEVDVLGEIIVREFGEDPRGRKRKATARAWMWIIKQDHETGKLPDPDRLRWYLWRQK